MILFVLQTYADRASTNANAIRMEANKTKIEALRLGNEAEKLHLRVDTTDSMMSQYEIQVTKDTNVTAEVKIRQLSQLIVWISTCIYTRIYKRNNIKKRRYMYIT